jgi:hypothetical protein
MFLLLLFYYLGVVVNPRIRLFLGNIKSLIAAPIPFSSTNPPSILNLDNMSLNRLAIVFMFSPRSLSINNTLPVFVHYS